MLNILCASRDSHEKGSTFDGLISQRQGRSILVYSGTGARRDLAESGGDRSIGLMVVINVISSLCGNSEQ